MTIKKNVNFLFSKLSNYIRVIYLFNHVFNFRVLKLNIVLIPYSVKISRFMNHYFWNNYKELTNLPN